MLCMSPSKMFLHIFAEFSYPMLLVMLCWFLFLYFLYFKQTFLLVSIKYGTHFFIGSNSVFVFLSGPFSSSLDKTLLFCWILVLQSTGDQTCKQGPSDVQLLLKNTGHSPLSCASAGCLKTFRLEALSLEKCPIAQGQDWGGRGKSNQTKWRRESPTRCWLTGRKRCGTSVWRSRKASNRYLQGILAPHAENGPKSRRQICRIMHHMDIMLGWDSQHEVCCTIPDGYASVIPTLGWLMSCRTVWTATSSHLQHWLVGLSRLLIAGHDAAAKARRTFETVLARTRRKLKSASSFQVGESSSVVSLFKCRFCIGFSWIGTREDILRCARRPRQLPKSKAWRWRISSRRDLKRWAQVTLIQTSPKLRPQRQVMSCNAKATCGSAVANIKRCISQVVGKIGLMLGSN